MILNLQVIRFLAALLVVAFHSAVTADVRYGLSNTFAAPLTSIGSARVDIFFVISGFLMVLMQADRSVSPGTYLIHRIARIAPLYWLLTLLIALLIVSVPSLAQEGTGLSIAHLFKSLFFISIFWNELPLMYVGWTLEYEVLFYIAFAVGVIFSTGVLRCCIAAGVLAIAALSGIFAPVAVEFAMGMSLAYIWKTGKLALAVPIAIVLGVVAILVLFPATPIVHEYSYLRPVLWGVPAVVIVAVGLVLPPIRKGILTYLGSASYSIYLIQVFTIPAVMKLGVIYVGRFQLPISPDFLVFISIVVTVFSGALLYRFVEDPMARATKRLLSRHKGIQKTTQPLGTQ